MNLTGDIREQRGELPNFKPQTSKKPQTASSQRIQSVQKRKAAMRAVGK
jgi:hypothetical protein